MPKDNEVEEKVIDSVSRYDTIVVDSGVHIYADTVESELGDYVRYDDYAALQGEVSRLRAGAERYCYLRDLAHPDSDEGFAVMRDEMNEWGKWCAVHITGDALDAAIDALNLEPPTDGC